MNLMLPSASIVVPVIGTGTVTVLNEVVKDLSGQPMTVELSPEFSWRTEVFSRGDNTSLTPPFSSTFPALLLPCSYQAVSTCR